jgi:hypothetical protein
MGFITPAPVPYTEAETYLSINPDSVLNGSTVPWRKTVNCLYICILYFFNSVSHCEGLQQAVGAGALGEAAGGTDGGQLPPLTEGAHASGTKEYR